ncbi:hypothetical protein HYU14_01565 [Candidatus Woesearchaeota archaeon]|nr:hypothetical protein [Candidatus Woesearchaeota archaeon]
MVNEAIKDFGYLVTQRPGQVPVGNHIVYGLSVRQDVDLKKHIQRNPRCDAIKALNETFPGLSYKGYSLEITISDGKLQPL